MRCHVEPLPDDQVSFQINGVERLRWHFSNRYPRPFFYPLVGPSGRSVTRMGHPGAPNHDHHRSLWFAHQKVLGINFWSDQTTAQIRQKQWLAYRDGNDEAIMAVRLGWYDGHDPAELIEQELVAAVRPLDAGETLVELQSTFIPRATTLEFGKTNFGFLAVRVAQRISAVFGSGQLTDSEGRQGEKNIFGREAVWMDYSSGESDPQREGVTCFDHSDNPTYPTHWHVRADGWMGAATTLAEPRTTTRSRPLALRYLIHLHRGDVDPGRADHLAGEFNKSPGFAIRKSPAAHHQFSVERSALGA